MSDLVRERFVARVSPGKGEAGAVLDFPTLNLDPTVPLELAHGMYGATVSYEGRTAGAVLYIGTRPTFEDDGTVSYEAHLLDVDPESTPLLDARILEVEVRFFLRPEREFSTVDALREQQFRDREVVRRRLGRSR